MQWALRLLAGAMGYNDFIYMLLDLISKAVPRINSALKQVLQVKALRPPGSFGDRLNHAASCHANYNSINCVVSMIVPTFLDWLVALRIVPSKDTIKTPESS